LEACFVYNTESSQEGIIAKYTRLHKGLFLSEVFPGVAIVAASILCYKTSPATGSMLNPLKTRENHTGSDLLFSTTSLPADKAPVSGFRN